MCVYFPIVSMVFDEYMVLILLHVFFVTNQHIYIYIYIIYILVGVVGSGRGMTSFQQRGKHLYNENKDDED